MHGIAPTAPAPGTHAAHRHVPGRTHTPPTLRQQRVRHTQTHDNTTTHHHTRDTDTDTILNRARRRSNAHHDDNASKPGNTLHADNTNNRAVNTKRTRIIIIYANNTGDLDVNLIYTITIDNRTTAHHGNGNAHGDQSRRASRREP